MPWTFYKQLRELKVILPNSRKILTIYFATKLSKIFRRKIIEIGVYKGGTSLFMAEVYGGENRHQQIMIDPFIGHPKQSVSNFDGKVHTPGHFSDTSINMIQGLFSKFRLPLPRIIPSPVELVDFDLEIFEDIGFVHLDTDLYIPTKHALNVLLPILPSFSIVIIDDYSSKKCPGVRLACKEFLIQNLSCFHTFVIEKDQLILVRKLHK
jgi:hypothetical protein